MKIVSWSVNGLARCRRNGLLKFLADAKPDVLCCQKIKGQSPLKTPEHLQFWNPAKRSNYSGTLALAKQQTPSYQYGLGIEKFDDEGRLIALEYKDYFIVNVYVPNPNPHSAPDRLGYHSLYDWLEPLATYNKICTNFLLKLWKSAMNRHVSFCWLEKNVIFCVKCKNGPFNTQSLILLYISACADYITGCCSRFIIF